MQADMNFSLLFEGICENYYEDKLDLIARFLPENPLILEAGAHHGYDTLSFALKWPNATIISFEANPSSFEKLREKTASIPNVRTHQLALNSYNGKAVLHVCRMPTAIDPVDEGASSLLETSEWMKDHYAGPKMEVPCVILDDWCRENRVDHVDFMWLDLEGVELQILQSSPKILDKVKVIYTETNFREFRLGMTQYAELRAFLENAGFTLFAHWYIENWQGDAIFINNRLNFEKTQNSGL